MNHLNSSRIARLSRGENTPGDPAMAPMLVNFIVGGLRHALPRPKSAKSPQKKAPLRREKP